MRIGICALGRLSEDSGGRTYAINFVRTCAEEKLPHEFFIFYSGPKEDVWGELPRNFHKVIVPFSHGPSWTKGFGLQFVLPLCIIGKKLDAVYFPNNFVSVLCFKPKVVAVRSTLYYHFPEEVPPVKRACCKIMSLLSVKLAHHILVPSESIARDAVRFMGAAPQKITVVPHGVDTRLFSQRATEAEIAPRLAAMGVRRPYFLFVSALWHYKEAGRFVEALSVFRQRTGRTDLVGAIAGKGLGAEAAFAQLERQINESGMHDVIRLLGQRSPEEVRHLYWGAEALVFPSYYESFGNPLVEAMAAGVPIIASNRHAVPETVGDAALIVDPDNVEGLAGAMERVLNDRALRQRLVAAGRARAADFSWRRAVQSTMALLVAPRRPRILLLGYWPPPYFGPSVTYQALMNSDFPRRFEVKFINISVVKSIAELEGLQIGKLLKLPRLLLAEFFHLLTRRFDFFCCPVSVNRNAFVKDALLLGLARAFGMPTVLYAHGNNLPDFHARSSPWVQRLIERTASRAAGAIVLGESLRFNFEKWLSPEKIFVVPTGIEPLARIPQFSKRKDCVTVLYLGNLVREKGVFVLLEASKIVAAKRGDLRFVFGGAWFRAEDEREGEDFVTGNGLEKTVEFVGPVSGDTKWRLVFSSDILAFPTFYYYETMGLVLLEAMQAGLPVVTTRRASIPEIIQDGVNGLLVEEQNPSDLAEKILQLAATC